MRALFFGILIIGETLTAANALADFLIPVPRAEHQVEIPPYQGCQSTREFVTTLEYLRDQKQLGLDEREGRKIAYEVAKGCTGAARRFQWSFEILLKTD